MMASIKKHCIARCWRLLRTWMKHSTLKAVRSLIAESKCLTTPTRLTPRVRKARRRAECIVHHDALLLPYSIAGAGRFLMTGEPGENHLPPTGPT